MPIDSVYIRNFKGINEGTWIDIKPITIFIGANSSGKSSCLHALACLSQTLKVPNNSSPVVIDDEYANVHLGRFIEVIHSNSYQDTISLGVRIKDCTYIEIHKDREKRAVKSKGDLEAIYEFKCSQRTQDIRVESANIKIGDLEFTIRWSSAGKYSLTSKKANRKISCRISPGFLVTPDSLFSTSSRDISDFIPLIHAQNQIQESLVETLYLGPFRESPRRKYETRGANPSEVGSRGESAITMLANETFQTNKRPHIKQIAGWLKELGLAEKLSLSRVGKTDLVDLKLGLNDGASLPIADLGYGLSQIMPVLTQCSFSPKGSTLLFEQPEIHLHTCSSRQLAKVFIDTVREKKSHALIETHSPDLIKQFIQEMKSDKLNADEFIVYKVARENEATILNPVEIDAENDFDVYENWEKGIST